MKKKTDRGPTCQPVILREFTDRWHWLMPISSSKGGDRWLEEKRRVGLVAPKGVWMVPVKF